MGKSLVDGREFFDGQPVELYEGRFTGQFYMSEVTGAALANDDLVTFIVTARVEAPKFSYVKKTGDLKRSNTMRVQSVIPIDYNEAKFMLDNMNALVAGVNDGLIESVVEENISEETTELFQDNWSTSE
jgi:hypothetical protein